MASVYIDIKDRDGKPVGEYCTVNLEEKDRLSSKENPTYRLFKGQFQSNRFPGIVAKIYTNNDTEDEPKSNYTICFERARENLEFLSLPGNKHPNLITYYGHDIIGKKIYLISELCICSVYKLIVNRQNVLTGEHAEMLNALSLKKILKQSTMAVNFLHGLGLVHRNLHPNNFLIQCISKEKDGNKYAVKLTDFHLAKDWEKNPKESNKYPMDGWRAVPDKKERDSKSDVYTLGCYFYFVLSKGGHPFKEAGDPSIYKETSEPYQKEWIPNDKNWAKDFEAEEAEKVLSLIKKMIKFEASRRLSMWQVLDSDYFQQDLSHYELYEDSSKTPGLCVIISQEKFYCPESDTDGIENDCAQLRRTFFRFGYEVIVYRNVEANELNERLEPNNLSKDTEKKDLHHYASLVVCILSHGDKGVVLGVDSVSVNIDYLKRRFNNYDCKELAGKPKIFIILACQGSGSQVVYHQPPPAYELLRLQRDVFTIEDTEDPKSAMEDFLTLKSTVDDFYSYYTPGVGSHFSEYLCGALVSEYNEKTISSSQEKSTKKSLVKLFHSYVVAAIGREEIGTGNGTFRQTPESRSSLTKTIRFRPQVSTSEIASLIASEREGLFVKYNGMDELKFWEKRENGVKQNILFLGEEIRKLESNLAKLPTNTLKYFIILGELEKKLKMIEILKFKEKEVLDQIKAMGNASGDSPSN